MGQDQLRREILQVADEPDNPTVGLIDLSVRYALERGLDVIVEGILRAHVYGPMLSRLVAEHRGRSHCYRYDLTFDETARRHATKPQANEYGIETLRSWWREPDPLPDVAEKIIGSGQLLVETTAAVLSDCGWEVGDGSSDH